MQGLVEEVLARYIFGEFVGIGIAFLALGHPLARLAALVAEVRGHRLDWLFGERPAGLQAQGVKAQDLRALAMPLREEAR